MQPLSAPPREGLAREGYARDGFAQGRGARLRREIAPSRIHYRLERLWLRPWLRSLVIYWLPGITVAAALWLAVTHPANLARIGAAIADVTAAVRERREFMLTGMELAGGSETLRGEVAAVAGVSFPVSSLDLDLEALRERIEALDAVQSAQISVAQGNILMIRVVERTPVVVMRTPEGLQMLDAEGFRVAALANRQRRADLPLILGEGAQMAVPEALRLMAVAAPVAPRIRALVRVGERRWDVALDRGQRILLPEAGAVTALERVMALNRVEDLLARDATHVDLRDGSRPTLRLGPHAKSELDRIRGVKKGEDT